MVIGTHIGDRYEILSEIGRGGMGTVYRAHDKVLERDVALKLVHPSHMSDVARERLRREARVVARMDHPSIVPVYDMGEEDGTVYVVMPLIEGPDLRDWLTEHRLRVGDVLRLGIQVAQALQYSHERDVLHRDIKPGNVLVTEEEGSGRLRFRVLDFGLALQSEDTRLTRSGQMVGTYTYVSPEQISGLEFDARSDLYSLATVLYECLAGAPPFRGDATSLMYRIAHELPRPLRSLGLDVDRELDAFLSRCLSKELAERPADADEFTRLLQEIDGRLSETERGTRLVPGPDALSVAPHEQELPLIGRAEQRAVLQQHLDAAVAGECQLVLLAGDVGVGKTRLLREVERLARARNIRVLHGRFVEQGGGLPLYGFCDLIQGAFRRAESSDSTQASPDLSDVAGELLAQFPVLAELEALRAQASDPALPLEPERLPARSEEDRTRVFELLARTLARLGGGRPLVLLLEELHQANLSVDALQYVVRRLGATPTLVVGTYRTSEVDKGHPLLKLIGGFESDRRFARLELEPFTPEEHRAFLAQLLGKRQVASSLASQLLEATEGNPFFSRELVRALVESRTIVEDDTGSLHISGDREISSDELPGTIQQAVERRIEGLPDELRGVLATASVLGRNFSYHDLESLAGEQGDVDQAVDKLISRGLLEEARGSRGDRLAFSSGIVREVVYTSLTRRRRRALHMSHAQRLEERLANHPERIHPQLLAHFSAADVPEKVLEHGPWVARMALNAFSASEAIRAANLVLDFIDDERCEHDLGLESETRLLLAEAQRMAGNTDAALKQAELAADLAEAEGHTELTSRALLFAAETAFAGRRIREAGQWIDRGLAATSGTDDVESYRGMLSLGATLANLRGDFERGLDLLHEAEKLESGAPGEEELPRGGRLSVAVSFPLEAVDPLRTMTFEETEVLSTVYEPLVTTDDRGHLVPWLCERWEFADEGRSIELTLREGVEFHDGHPLDAQAVKASFELAIARNRGTSFAAFSAIRGFSAETPIDDSGAPTWDAPPVEGIRVLDARRLRIELSEPLPIYPALLTSPQAMVVRRGEPDASGAAALYGTGPYRLPEGAVTIADHMLLPRNERYWRPGAPVLDELEFVTVGASADCARRLRSGELDLVNALQPEDLDELLGDSRFRSSYAETTRKNTYVVLFNTDGPVCADPEVRRALAGALRVDDLVWGALGRLAQPTTSMIPPGVLGHDPGRRRRHLGMDEARALLADAQREGPLVLRVAIHPIFRGTRRRLWDAILHSWRELGVEVEVVIDTMTAFKESWSDAEGIDLIVERMTCYYSDPDDFTYGVFHGSIGELRQYFSSARTDELAERARSESDPEHRQALYRKFERYLLDENALVPLCHDVDVRIASPRVRGLRLTDRPPFVNYAQIGVVSEEEREPVPSQPRGTVRVPSAGTLRILDPAVARSPAIFDLLLMVYEPLTRIVRGGRVSPWLAAEVVDEDDGRRYRVTLRDDVHFHNGRRMTTRDVRFSFERLLQRGGRSAGLLASIVGADKVRSGKAKELEGVRLISATELLVELEGPLPIFPQLLSHPAVSILPEGPERRGLPAPGTGPFSVAHFEPADRLELAANPDYWRRDRPRAAAVVFDFDILPERILEGFVGGHYSIASDLLPADAHALRDDPRFAPGYREAPFLSTALLQFNTVSGPLSDVELRRSLMESIDVEGIVRAALPRQALPAENLIPPGLLGVPSGPGRSGGQHGDSAGRGAPQIGPLDLRAAVMPHPSGQYAAVARLLLEHLETLGVRVQLVGKNMAQFFLALEGEGVDLVVGRCVAEYPDPDSFMRTLYDPASGFMRNFYGSAELDERIERARRETDARRRHAIYREIEQLLRRDAVLLPLFHEQSYRFAQPEVQGLRLGLFYPSVAYDELALES